MKVVLFLVVVCGPLFVFSAYDPESVLADPSRAIVGALTYALWGLVGFGCGWGAKSEDEEITKIELEKLREKYQAQKKDAENRSG